MISPARRVWRSPRVTRNAPGNWPGRPSPGSSHTAKPGSNTRRRSTSLLPGPARCGRQRSGCAGPGARSAAPRSGVPGGPGCRHPGPGPPAQLSRKHPVQPRPRARVIGWSVFFRGSTASLSSRRRGSASGASDLRSAVRPVTLCRPIPVNPLSRLASREP